MRFCLALGLRRIDAEGRCIPQRLVVEVGQLIGEGAVNNQRDVVELIDVVQAGHQNGSLADRQVFRGALRDGDVEGLLVELHGRLGVADWRYGRQVIDGDAADLHVADQRHQLKTALFARPQPDLGPRLVEDPVGKMRHDPAVGRRPPRRRPVFLELIDGDVMDRPLEVNGYAGPAIGLLESRQTVDHGAQPNRRAMQVGAGLGNFQALRLSQEPALKGGRAERHRVAVGGRQDEAPLETKVEGQFLEVEHVFGALVTPLQHRPVHGQGLLDRTGEGQHPAPAGQVEANPFDLAFQGHPRRHPAFQRQRESAKGPELVIHRGKGDRRNLAEIGDQVEPLQRRLINPGKGDFRLPAIDVDVQVDGSPDPGGVADQAHVGRGRDPGLAQQLVVQGHLGVDDFETAEVAHCVTGNGRREKLVQKPLGEIRRRRLGVHEADVDAAAEFPPHSQPGAEQLDALGRQLSADKGPAADQKRHFRDSADEGSVLAHDPDVENPDIEGPVPSRPCQDGILQGQFEIRLSGVYGFLDIRRQEGKGNRPGRQLPRHHHQDDGQADAKPPQHLDDYPERTPDQKSTFWSLAAPYRRQAANDSRP